MRKGPARKDKARDHFNSPCLHRPQDASVPHLSADISTTWFLMSILDGFYPVWKHRPFANFWMELLARLRSTLFLYPKPEMFCPNLVPSLLPPLGSLVLASVPRIYFYWRYLEHMHGVFLSKQIDICMTVIICLLSPVTVAFCCQYIQNLRMFCAVVLMFCLD